MVAYYRRALVTGASSGIGAALSLRLAAAGTSVVLCARRVSELESVAAQIHAKGGHARVRPLDVANSEETVAAIRELDAVDGGFDLIVANAGVGTPPVTRVPNWESIAAAVRVNFEGAIATLAAVLPQMVARGCGHLVGMSSIAAFGPLPRNPSYCASKAGLSRFLESLRIDLRGTGVKITAIHPGFVRTVMTDPNPFPMPFLLELDDAVERIVRSLPAAPATIDFPLPMVAAAQLCAHLPRPLRDLVMRTQGFV